MAEWTEELRKEVIDEYVAENPTPETSSEIIAEIVESHKDKGLTINGVRMVLLKAKVYVKKEDAKKPEGSTTTSKRVNKAEAIKGLSTFISSQDIEVDDEILGKLTGKAAVYLLSVLEQVADK